MGNGSLARFNFNKSAPPHRHRSETPPEPRFSGLESIVDSDRALATNGTSTAVSRAELSVPAQRWPREQIRNMSQDNARSGSANWYHRAHGIDGRSSSEPTTRGAVMFSLHAARAWR